MPNERAIMNQEVVQLMLEEGYIGSKERTIQSTIDQYRFLLGYQYKLVSTRKLPQLETAKFDEIYVQLSGYKKVIRQKTIHTTDVEAPLINDPSALYITSVTGEKVTFSWGASESREITLSDKIIRLLPDEDKDEDQISSNPTLLRELFKLLDLNATDNNILLCTVKCYDGTYNTKIITAKDLELEGLKKTNEVTLKSLPADEKRKKLEEFEIIAENANINDRFIISSYSTILIIDMMVEAEYANYGLAYISDQQKFLPDSYKTSERIWTTRLLSSALVSEASFAYLEYITSYEGWITVLNSVSASQFLSISGTIADFVVNVWTISPHADADALSVRVLVEVSKNMEMLIPLINFASDISYFTGGAGNAIGILTLLDPLYENHPGWFYTLAALALIIVSPIGRAYYQAFNIRHLLNTLKILDDYFSAKKEHIDHAFSRELMVGLITTFVVAFRSIGFGGIAVILLENLKIKNAWANLIFGLGATIVTAVQILSTRWYRINMVWCNNDFSLLHPHEKQSAWKELTWCNDIMQGCVLTWATLESFIMACSAPFFTMDSKASFFNAFSNSVATYVLVCLGIAYVFTTCYAQIDLAINNKALSKIKSNGIKIQDRKHERHDFKTVTCTEETQNPMALRNLDQRHEVTQLCGEFPLSENDIMHRNIDGAEKIFANSRTTYITTWAVRLTAFLFCSYSVLTRGLGFLDYINKTNSMIQLMVIINAYKYQVIGLGLLLAPPNIHNMFDMFYSNMSEYIAQKESEASITYINQRSGKESFKAWACSNTPFFINPFKGWAFYYIPGSNYLRNNVPFFGSYTGESLYTKGGLTYTAGELIKPLNDKIKDLEAQLSAF